MEGESKENVTEDKLLDPAAERSNFVSKLANTPSATIDPKRQGKQIVAFSVESDKSEEKTFSEKSWIEGVFGFLNPQWEGWEIKSQKVIRAFNAIKVLYIFMLVPYHITIVAQTVDNNPSYGSYSLNYPTSVHGLEYMMGLLFISGWLSHNTTKPGSTIVDILKKKLLRLLPAYYIGAIPLTLFCIIFEGANGLLTGKGGVTGVAVEFVLEFFTVGSWNPALLFWTRNRPLWFISVLLTYHYCSSTYLPWVRARGTNTLLCLLIAYNVLRIAIGVVILRVLIVAYPGSYHDYPRILHLWSVTQLFLPFVGATLAEYATRIGKLQWSRNAIWRATDFVTVLTFCLAFFVLSPPLWTDDFAASEAGYFLGSACAYLNLLVWPCMLVGVYLYSHDLSTLTWLYDRFPKLWNEGLAMSYPLYLTHWPVLLLLEKSQAYDRNNSVSVIMIFAVCLCTSSFLDTYIISPLEDRIVAHFDPPQPQPQAKPKQANRRASEVIRYSLKLHELESNVEERDELIHQLDEKVAALEEQLKALNNQRIAKRRSVRKSLAAFDPVEEEDEAEGGETDGAGNSRANRPSSNY